MANKHRGYVEIELDRKRYLRFTTDAFVELEECLGHSVFKINEDNMSIKTIRAMLWSSLLHEQPGLTIQETSNLMDSVNKKDLIKNIMLAFRLAFKDEELSEEEKKILME